MSAKKGAVAEVNSGLSFKELDKTMRGLLKKKVSGGRFVIQLKDARECSFDTEAWLGSSWMPFRERFYGNGRKNPDAQVADLEFVNCGKRIEGVFA
jgi:hypothetical protein